MLAQAAIAEDVDFASEQVSQVVPHALLVDGRISERRRVSTHLRTHALALP